MKFYKNEKGDIYSREGANADKPLIDADKEKDTKGDVEISEEEFNTLSNQLVGQDGTVYSMEDIRKMDADADAEITKRNVAQAKEAVAEGASPTLVARQFNVRVEDL